MTRPSEAQIKLPTLVAATGIYKSAFGMTLLECPEINQSRVVFRESHRTVCT